MSQNIISLLEIAGDASKRAEHKALQERMFTMDIAVKKAMDAGLTSDDMKIAEAVRGAVQSAQVVVEKLGS